MTVAVTVLVPVLPAASFTEYVIAGTAPTYPDSGVYVTTPRLFTEYVPLPVIATEVSAQLVVVLTAQSLTELLSIVVPRAAVSLAVTSTVIAAKVLPESVSAATVGAPTTVDARVA